MQARSHSEIPLAEYTVSTTIDAPQLLLYTRVAEDLQAWMVKSKAEFVIAEEEAAKMTPELFTEFSRADEESQGELLVSCYDSHRVWRSQLHSISCS